MAMNSRSRFILACMAVVAAGALAGCARPTETIPSSQEPTASSRSAPVDDGASSTLTGELTVFAAASLTAAFDTIAGDLMARNADLTIRINFMGTQELLAQLEQGARADVFISADQSHMDKAIESGLVESPALFAENKLCVVAYPDESGVRSLDDLLREGVGIIVAVAECPVGLYTRQCWEKMGKSPRFGPRFVAGVNANLRSTETNVKLVVAKVRMGEADAGFVYESDAIGEGDAVLTIPIPDDVQVKATYHVATCADSSKKDLAAFFIDALAEPEAQATLRANGLTPVD